MSLRKQEWLKRLASEGRLFQAIANYDYLVKKAKALRISENSARTLSKSLLNQTYRPLDGNEVDSLLVDTVLEIIEAIVKEDTGLEVYKALKATDLKLVKLEVEKLDLGILKKELFGLLKLVLVENELIDLVWKAAKIKERDVLIKLAPLLKLKNTAVFIKDGQMLSLSKKIDGLPENSDLSFAGYLIKLDPICKVLPAKSAIEMFKKSVKHLTERSKTGFSARYTAIEISKTISAWHTDFGFCTDSRLSRYLDSYVRERVYLFLLKKYDKAGKKEVYQRFMLGYPTLEGITIPSMRPVGEPCAGKLARTVRGAGN